METGVGAKVGLPHVQFFRGKNGVRIFGTRKKWSSSVTKTNVGLSGINLEK